MKLLISICLLTIPFLFQQTPKVFDCVVVDVRGGIGTVVSDSRNPQCSQTDNQPICAHATLDIPLENWPDAWPKAEKGAVVHAQWVEGHFTPVACKSEQMHGLYDRPALNKVKGKPEADCSQAPSGFIRDLLERMNK